MAEPSRYCLDLMAGPGAESPISEQARSSHHLVAHALPDAKAARRARQIVREVLRDAGVDEPAVGDAELAVGELAANAVSHAEGPYEIRFVVAGGRPIWCEVIDSDSDLVGIPEVFAKLHQDASLDGPAHADEMPQESGHGLAIVHRLAGGRCRAYPTIICATGRPGKAVAFALPGGGCSF
ncbi:ATP-binding protein [Actinomadura montaniterrae]|nr:ATP-binding protein [Actinomadura montaniterrae]